MAHVADVQRSVSFYELLGLKMRNTLKATDGTLVWAHVECELAELMFTRADAPVVISQQAVLFYLYSPDLVALREHLPAKGVQALGNYLSQLHARRRNASGRPGRLRVADRAGG
jgi:hypothetical protein